MADMIFGSTGVWYMIGALLVFFTLNAGFAGSVLFLLQILLYYNIFQFIYYIIYIGIKILQL